MFKEVELFYLLIVHTTNILKIRFFTLNKPPTVGDIAYRMEISKFLICLKQLIYVFKNSITFKK